MQADISVFIKLGWGFCPGLPQAEQNGAVADIDCRIILISFYLVPAERSGKKGSTFFEF